MVEQRTRLRTSSLVSISMTRSSIQLVSSLPKTRLATSRNVLSMLASQAMTAHVAITASKFQMATAMGSTVLSKRRAEQHSGAPDPGN